MRMMDALQKQTAAPGLTLTRVPVPTPKEDEVLIKIHKTAICGTDLHIYEWNKWAQETIKPPLVAGHEYVGEIAEMGSMVKGLRIGERVSGEGTSSAATAATAARATASGARTPRAWA